MADAQAIQPLVCRDCGTQQGRPTFPFPLAILGLLVTTISWVLCPPLGVFFLFAFIILVGRAAFQPRCRECGRKAMIPSRTPEGQRIISGAGRAGMLLVALLSGAAAADREVLTLTDGRTLTGVYDADAGTVTMDGHGTAAVVKVRADQVKAREAAPVKQAAPLTTPKAAEVVDAKAETGDRTSPEDLMAETSKIYADAHQQMDARNRAWVAKAHLALLPEPKLAVDPRASEIARNQKVHAVNGAIAQVLGCVERRDDEQELGSAIARLANVWPQYLELTAKPTP